ncbi:hypothetical protein EJ05DRAFT_20680 [Pseudovirgaria hyperparasitica]|uniref:N-acetyltransferase domain-containing protein n=1 Tax=Pseudovirgaria hyperparasitica TaxID=470096 RepID=A0A6A6WL51_9PEZI|nr:uncharacterized protein EJ05DRAFT_20680 [Pseudovirgaria hyperparasitica]KAF2762925.1 hypothetical protein EJ05DRAFT_20680 [Pseudovirgaria hyperparasitica]
MSEDQQPEHESTFASAVSPSPPFLSSTSTMDNAPASELALIPPPPISSQPSSSIQILPLKPEDCRTWQIMHYTCHADHMRDLLALRPFSPASWTRVVAAREQELSQPGVHAFKAVDVSTTPPTIAAIAKWTVYAGARDETDGRGDRHADGAADGAADRHAEGSLPTAPPPARGPAPPVQTAYTAHPDPPPELNVRLLNALLTPLRETRKEVMAGRQAYVMLNSMTTFPAYQRRGIARRLMQWGLDRADELGVEVYLDASAAARRLYEGCAFELVRTHVFDVEAWGGGVGERHYTYVNLCSEAEVR